MNFKIKKKKRKAKQVAYGVKNAHLEHVVTLIAGALWWTTWLRSLSTFWFGLFLWWWIWLFFLSLKSRTFMFLFQVYLLTMLHLKKTKTNISLKNKRVELCFWFITSPLWWFAFHHEKFIIFVFQSKIIYNYIIYKWPVVHFKIQCCHLEKTLNLIHWWKKIKESIIQQIRKEATVYPQ